MNGRPGARVSFVQSEEDIVDDRTRERDSDVLVAMVEITEMLCIGSVSTDKNCASEPCVESKFDETDMNVNNDINDDMDSDNSIYLDSQSSCSEYESFDEIKVSVRGMYVDDTY